MYIYVLFSALKQIFEIKAEIFNSINILLNNEWYFFRL